MWFPLQICTLDLCKGAIVSTEPALTVAGSGRQPSGGKALRSRLGQRESDEGIAEFFFGDFGMAAGGDDYVLLAIDGHPISHRRGIGARRQLGLPQFFAG